MTDEDDPDVYPEVSFEEVEMRRAFQKGVINTPERKAARLRAAEAGQKAADLARSLGVAPSERFVLADNHAIAKAAGLALPGNWLTRLWARLLRWFR